MHHVMPCQGIWVVVAHDRIESDPDRGYEYTFLYFRIKEFNLLL